MKELVKLIKKARFVFVCGNGGSAATAEHFSNDLFSRGIRAMCLNSNMSIMTMIANDFGYEWTFRKQLDLYANKEDLVIVFSGSGNSKNILKALKGDYKTYAILGMGGGEAKYEKGKGILVDSYNYEEIEDEHLSIVHQIKKLL